MIVPAKMRFCERLIHLNRAPISFAGRPYLLAIYACTERNLVLRCSRQTEKSTFLVNTILYEACTRPGIQLLLVCPRVEQARVFSNSRLLPALHDSPVIRRALLGKRGRRPRVMDLEFVNGSRLFIRAAYHSGDSCRGLSIQLLLVDEVQDVAADLPVLAETMSHAPHARMILCGTPKLIDNHLEGMFEQSTANEWTITCPQCQKGVILDEHSLGPNGLACPSCKSLLDPKQGSWIARNPQASWGDGFWIGHPMVPWLNYDKILERQCSYDIANLKNEVLGLPTALGDHVVTRAELEACCGKLPMAETLAQIPPPGRQKLIAGIDWGGGGTSRTVLVLGFMRNDFVFQVCRMERFAASEEPERVLAEVARRCEQFQVKGIAADGGGNGHVFNRLLLERLRRQRGLVAILYSTVEHPPRQDGVLVKWTVNRSATIGALFSRVKKQSLLFPQLEDSRNFLSEFACELAEYDDITRTVRYSHPETQQDDMLHATNYALFLAVRSFSAQEQTWEDWG